MLSEINQTVKKTNIVWSHLYVDSKIVKLLETEKRMVVTRSWRTGEILVKGHKLPVKIRISPGDLMHYNDYSQQ